MNPNQQAYQQALKHPLWQRKRLLILERDNWTCRKCKSQETELQVHHLNYRYGLAPHLYSDSELVCLCVDCHFKETLIQIFDRYQLQGAPISKLAFSFGNCKGDPDKLEAIIDVIYWLSTLTAPEVEEYVMAAEIKSQLSHNPTNPHTLNGKEINRLG